MDLNVVWYILVGVLIAGYAILDGFDLGVGVLSLFARDEEERRLHLNAIGPFWDGNEVWLLTAGGALFAAFPVVYAAIFSGFYLAMMLVLVGLIFRAVSIEFYGQVNSPAWRKAWGIAFGVGSLLPAILLGVAFGNILHGVPIGVNREFIGSFFTLLNPYSLLIGVLSLTMFVMHGAAFMTIKTGDALQARMSTIAIRAWLFFAFLYICATAYTMLQSRFLFEGIASSPLFYCALITLVIGVGAFPAAMRSGKHLLAFAASSLSILSMIGLSGISLFPRLVPSTYSLALSLTAYNASSTPKTLGVMLIVALMGMPLVIVYTAFLYWVFRGKTKLSEHEGY
jgi:cytochrome d ubiquinol oxidase subunit II